MNRRTMLLANRGLAILKQEGNHSFPFLDLFVSTCIYTPYVSIYIIYLNLRLPGLT